MRKLFLILAVLLVASAAYAAEDVNVYCTTDGATVTVSYIANTDANTPRAFGLDIKLSNDANITSVTALSTDYWVFPGSYTPGGNDPNGPVGVVAHSSDTLGGIDTNGMTIEMGSLHSPPGAVSNPNAPGATGDLLEFTVSGDCSVAISGNAARGKVVLYDATNEDPPGNRDILYTGCEVITECYAGQADYTEWESVGKPLSWCYLKQCHGDATNSDEEFPRGTWVSVGAADVAVLLQGYNDPVYVDPATDPWIAADFNHNDEEFPRGVWVRVGAADVAILLAYYNDEQSTVPADCLD